jgi:hypothetical protein
MSRPPGVRGHSGQVGPKFALITNGDFDDTMPVLRLFRQLRSAENGFDFLPQPFQDLAVGDTAGHDAKRIVEDSKRGIGRRDLNDAGKVCSLQRMLRGQKHVRELPGIGVGRSLDLNDDGGIAQRLKISDANHARQNAFFSHAPCAVMNHIFPDQTAAMQWPILLLINLVAALLCFSFLAYAMAQRRWRGHAAGLLTLALLLCSCVWLIPEGIRALHLSAGMPLASLWLADWSGAIVTLSLAGHALKRASPAVAESARLDGCGPFGLYWHIVLPLVRPLLFLSALLVAVVSCLVLVLPLSPAWPDPAVLIGGIILPLAALGTILFFLRRLP